MTPGEPLEETKDAVLPGSEPYGPGPNRSTMLSDTAELLAQTMEKTVPDETRGEDEDETLLDAEVRSLLHAIAEEESEHDEAWVAASRLEIETETEIEDGAEIEDTFSMDDALFVQDAPERREIEDPPASREAEPVDGVDDGVDDLPMDVPDAPAIRAESPEDRTDTPPADEDVASIGDGTRLDMHAAPDTAALEAIDALGERFEAAEARNDEALGRIGHALAMIATRIDGLETRATDRTIADVALVAAPPEDDEEDDASVAPYIARAEKELKAKKESGSMDIFDRIARAAETEFDEQAGSTPSRVIANASDGRRVGTKRWQPSKAVKKRMQQLEKARAESAAGGEMPARAAPAPRGLHVETEEQAASHAPQVDASMAPADEPEPAFDPHDEDAGLSVVPGARGRRRNRARKSSLDSDFENVFAEEGDKPSIQSLRRKMREKPMEAPEEEKSKGGMLGGILGRKPPKKAEPDMPEPALSVPVTDEEDDDALATAFETAGAPAAPAASGKAAKASAKAAKARAEAKAMKASLDLDEDDDHEDDWDDEDDAAPSGARRKPLAYALIAAAAAAGLVVWKMFIA